MPHDCESEAEAAVRARSRAIRLAEAFGDVRQKLRRDAWSSVAHLDLHVSFVLIDSNTDSAAARSKFRSIRKQVPHDLLQSIGVAGDDLEIFLKLRLDPDVLRFERWPDCIQRRRYDRDQIDWSKMQLQLAGDNPRNVEDVFNDLFLRPRVPFNHLDRVNRAFIVETTGFQYSRPANHGI